MQVDGAMAAFEAMLEIEHRGDGRMEDESSGKEERCRVWGIGLVGSLMMPGQENLKLGEGLDAGPRLFRSNFPKWKRQRKARSFRSST